MIHMLSAKAVYSISFHQDAHQRSELVKELHKLKTELFMTLIDKGELPLRPGVRNLIGTDIHLCYELELQLHLSLTQ